MDEGFEIFVITPNKKTEVIYVCDDDTVGHVKMVLQSSTRLHRRDQILKLDGVELEDDLMMEHYGIQRGTTLHMTTTGLRGSGKRARATKVGAPGTKEENIIEIKAKIIAKKQLFKLDIAENQLIAQKVEQLVQSTSMNMIMNTVEQMSVCQIKELNDSLQALTGTHADRVAEAIAPHLVPEFKWFADMSDHCNMMKNYIILAGELAYCREFFSNKTGFYQTSDFMSKVNERWGSWFLRLAADFFEQLQIYANTCKFLRTVANFCEQLHISANSCKFLRTLFFYACGDLQTSAAY